MTEFVPLVAFSSLIITVVQFLKYVEARDWKSTRNQAIAWTAGVGVTLLFAATSFASGIPIGDRNLDALGPADLIVVGLSAAGFAGVAFKAITPRGTTAGGNTE